MLHPVAGNHGRALQQEDAMQTRNRLIAGVLAAFLGLAGLACEDYFEGDALEEDAPAEDGNDDDGGY
jgi:hypothetical protein